MWYNIITILIEVIRMKDKKILPKLYFANRRRSINSNGITA